MEVEGGFITQWLNVLTIAFILHANLFSYFYVYLYNRKADFMKWILFILIFLPLFAKSQIITTIAGNGTAGYIGNGGTAIGAEMNLVSGVALDSTGNIYISEYGNHVIRKVSASGIISTFAGTGVAGDSGAGGPATSAQIWRPSGIIVDHLGNVIFSDCDNHKVKKISTSGIITTIAGNGTPGDSGDGGPAISAQLHYPEGIVFDSIGNMYFGDFDNNKIRKVDTSGIISTFAGTGASGYTGDGGPASAATLNNPYGVAISSSGEFYIGDYHNNVIRKINTSGVITTVAGTGVAGYSGDGGPATAAQFNLPKGIFFDHTGNLLIAEFNGDRIRKIDPLGIVSTIAGKGIAGYSGDGGLADSAELRTPETITVDVHNNIFIADYGNNVIRKIIPGTLNIENVRSNTLNIFPSPTATELTIYASDRITALTISNLLGQTVYANKYNAVQVQIDVSDLPPGVYIVRVNNSLVRKFVKE